MSRDFSALQLVSRTDFESLVTNLRDMEEECKQSLGYVHLGNNYSVETRELVAVFLENATQRIISMKVVISRVMKEYERFLSWFGLPPHLHKVTFQGFHLKKKYSDLILE